MLKIWHDLCGFCSLVNSIWGGRVKIKNFKIFLYLVTFLITFLSFSTSIYAITWPWKWSLSENKKQDDQSILNLDEIFGKSEKISGQTVPIQKKTDEQMITEIKKKYGYEEEREKEFLIRDNPIIIEGKDGTRLIIERVIKDVAHKDDVIKVLVSTFRSNSIFEDEDYEAMGQGFDITIFGDDNGNLYNPVDITLTNPLIERYITEAQKLLEDNHNLSGMKMPGMINLISTAFAQSELRGIGEKKSAKRPIGEGIEGMQVTRPSPTEVPPPSAAGEPTAQDRYLNNSPFEVKEEGYGIAFEGTSWPVRYLTTVPTEFNFERRGLVFRVPALVNPFMGAGLLKNVVAKLTLRLFGPSGMTTKLPDVVKPKEDAQVIDSDCVYVWWDSYVHQRRERKQAIAWTEAYKKNPLFKLCGLQNMNQMENEKYQDFLNIFPKLLTKIWKFYTGNDIASTDFGQQDSLNIKNYPVSCSTMPELDVNIKKLKPDVAGHVISKSHVSSAKCLGLTIEFNAENIKNFISAKKQESSIIIDGKNEKIVYDSTHEMCSLIAHEYMHAFETWNRYTSKGKSYSDSWSESIANYMEEELCDKSISPWEIGHGSLLDGCYNIYGTASKSAIVDSKSPAHAGGYLGSTYLRTLHDFRGKFLKGVLDGTIDDIFEYTAVDGKTLSKDETDRLKGLELVRFMKNLAFCRIFSGDTIGLAPNEGWDTHKDINGEIIQESNISSLSSISPYKYDFYNWLICDKENYNPNRMAEFYKFGTNEEVFNLGLNLSENIPQNTVVFDDKKVAISFERLAPTRIYPLDNEEKIETKYPVLFSSMMPYSAIYRRFKLNDERKVDNGENALNFYFYGKDLNWIEKRFKNMYVVLMIVYPDGSYNFRESTFYQLQYYENEKLVITSSVEPTKPLDMLVKKLEVPLGSTDLFKEKSYTIGVLFINANKNGYYESSTRFPCSDSDNDCWKFGEICQKDLGKKTGICIDNRKDKTKLLFRAEIGPSDPCPEGLVRTLSGECGCKVASEKWGKDCDDGFKAEINTVTKVCSCVPKCNSTQKWDEGKKECVLCAVGEYNAWYDAEAKGKNTECKKCVNNTSPMKFCGGKDQKCSVSCGCDSPLKLGKDEQSKPICIAPCELGDRWDGKKCGPCKYWETSSLDRMRCISCSPKNIPNDSKTLLNGCTNCDDNILFFTLPGTKGCDRFYNRCSKGGAETKWSYNTNSRSCTLCPKGEWTSGANVSQCIKCPSNSIYDSVIGCKCPSGSIVNFWEESDPLKWICKCPPNAVFSQSGCVCVGGMLPKAANNPWKVECACPTGTTNVSGKCVTVPQCPAGKILVNNTCYWEAGRPACSRIFLSDGRLLGQNVECTASYIYKCEYSKWEKHYCPAGYNYIEANQCSIYNHNHGGDLCCLKQQGVTIDYVHSAPYTVPGNCCPVKMNAVNKNGVMVCE